MIGYRPSIGDKLIRRAKQSSFFDEIPLSLMIEYYHQLANSSKDDFKALNKIANFITSHINHNTSSNFFLEYDELSEGIDFIDEISLFCIKEDIDERFFYWAASFIFLTFFVTTKDSFLGLDISIRKLKYIERVGEHILKPKDIHVIHSELIPLNLHELERDSHTKFIETVNLIYEVVNHNLGLLLETHDNILSDPKYLPPYAIRHILQTSIIRSMEYLQKHKYIGKILHKDIDTKILDQLIDEMQQIANYANKDERGFQKALRYAISHPDTHFLGTIITNDKIKIDLNTYEFYFEKFSEATTTGYWQKGIYLANHNQKKKIIKEIEQTIAYNKEIAPDNKETIKRLESLKDFLVQDKRYSKYIPYKVIAKKLNMNTKQVKNFIKAIFPDDIATTYKRTYEKIQDKISLAPLNPQRG